MRESGKVGREWPAECMKTTMRLRMERVRWEMGGEGMNMNERLELRMSER